MFNLFRRFRFLAFALVLLTSAPAFADSDKDCAPVSVNINPTETQATDDYINLTDETISTTAAAEDEFIVPLNVKVHSLRVDVDAAPVGTDRWDIFVVDDGTSTAVTCTITGAATTCESTLSAVASVAKGSDLTVLVDSGLGASDPALAAEMRISFCVDL